MREYNLSHLMGEVADATAKDIRANNKARKAINKAKRKMRKALRTKHITEMRILLGMAQVAIDKANNIARMGR